MVIKIKTRYDDINFNSLIINSNNQELIEYLKSYKEKIEEKINNCENIIITGDVGVGKSFIIKSFINELSNVKVDVEYKDTNNWNSEKHKFEISTKKSYLNITYAKMYEVITTLRKIYDKEKEDYSINYNDKDLLVIDEVGVQFSTDAERQILFDLFNYRYENFKPTILISNFPARSNEKIKGIDNILGNRIIDRILSGTSREFVLKGKSMR